MKSSLQRWLIGKKKYGSFKKKKELYVNRYTSNIVRSRTLKNIKTHDFYQYLQALVWLKTPVNLTVPSTTITFTFTFMHLADAFIQHSGYTFFFFYQYVCSLGIEQKYYLRNHKHTQ